MAKVVVLGAVTVVLSVVLTWLSVSGLLLGPTDQFSTQLVRPSLLLNTAKYKAE